MREISTLILVLMVATSSMVAVGKIAAEIPKPAVPEFTIRLAAHPYNVATTYSTDPYTGETITRDGYLVENRSIEVTVKNQAYGYSNGSNFQIYFNVHTKPHFGEGWTELFPTRNWPVDPIQYAHYIENSPKQSSTDYTIITIPLDSYPENGQVDFQVEAMVGHTSLTFVADHPLAPILGGEYYEAIAYDTSSGWSKTQTISIPDGSVFLSTSSPSPITSPTIAASQESSATHSQPKAGTSVLPGLDWVGIIIVTLLSVVVVLLFFVVVFLRRRR